MYIKNGSVLACTTGIIPVRYIKPSLQPCSSIVFNSVLMFSDLCVTDVVCVTCLL